MKHLLLLSAIVAVICFISCGGQDDNGPIPDPVYAGSYVGTWTDGIGSFPFSLQISEGDSIGKIWYSPNFMSCCGGGSTEDVNFTMTVEGSTITAFNMVQYLVDYPQGSGDHCPTTATATGSFSIEAGKRVLSLDPFQFSDCDGSRTVTVFKLTKQ